MSRRSIRIGNASGYWGDDPFALKRQIEKGPLDYITMDFLAEITMSILKKQQAKNPEKGYAHDIIPMLRPVLKQMIAQKTKLITNAGGINPKGCALAIQQLAKELGLSLKVAIVYGDDILSELDELQTKGASFVNMETKEPFKDVSSRIEAANVYFGALPVVYALKKWDPHIIITGRVTDTGITLAPMIHEFGWSFTDWDKLASGIVAGHILECGSQSTGGNFTDWHKVPSFKDMGYPIAEVYEDGSFVVTKHEGTGGLVTVDTVREQLFYEMGHPKAYITPDVVADFSTIHLEEDGKDRVKVSQVKGYEPTNLYKISMAYKDGFKVSGSVVICGPETKAKAQTFASIFWDKWQAPLTEKETEYLGWNALHRSLTHKDDGNEILLRLSARSPDEQLLLQFSRLIPSLILSGPSGVAAFGGSAKPQNIMSYWPALMDKNLVHPKIALCVDDLVKDEQVIKDTQKGFFETPSKVPYEQIAHKPSRSLDAILKEESSYTQTLGDLCLARSGDKGDMANIGLIARDEKAYHFIKEYVTAQRVKDWFQELCLGTVTRYELDKLHGLNFLLDESLGGGGSCTLRTDAQGKTFSQALLRQKVKKLG